LPARSGLCDARAGDSQPGPDTLDFFTTWKAVYIDYSDKLQRAQIHNAEWCLPHDSRSVSENNLPPRRLGHDKPIQ
jgi:hypothetical protein